MNEVLNNDNVVRTLIFCLIIISMRCPVMIQLIIIINKMFKTLSEMKMLTDYRIDNKMKYE